MSWPASVWAGAPQGRDHQRLGREVWNAIHLSLVRHGPATVALVSCPARVSETWHRDASTERFYIRASNATEELNGSGLLSYVRERWPA
jgi:hypothetical protein